MRIMKSALLAVMLASATMGAAVLVTPAIADVASSKTLVDAAKAKGIVGEQNNGYLGYVTATSDAALKAAVTEINAGRRDVFAQAAAKNGVAVEAAGVSAYANSILPKVKSGEYYQDGTGAWIKK